MDILSKSRERQLARLREIKKFAVRAILPQWEHVGESYYATIAAFPISYSMGRAILEFCREFALDPIASRVLIVGAYGPTLKKWPVG